MATYVVSWIFQDAAEIVNVYENFQCPFYAQQCCLLSLVALQLEPKRLMWPWVNNPAIRNDFFQFVSPEGLGVGGAGHWAISIDEELLHGSSGPCDTFANPCLASREEFEVMAVELWHVH